MLEKVAKLLKEVENFNPKTAIELENFRLDFLGKKGKLNELFTSFKLVANKDKKSPEAQPYLDDTPYGGSVPLSRETELLASLEKLRLALRSGSDLGPDVRDALIDVVDTMLGVPPRRITEGYVDHRDDSPLEPATARLLADYIVVGFETRHGVTMDQSDREENIKILMYTMSRDPGVARRLYDTVRDMEMDSDKHGKSLVGHHSGKPYGR